MKFKRLGKQFYGMCPGTTNDKQKELLQMQIINTVEEKKHFPPNVNKRKLREQKNYLIWLGASQLNISKRKFKIILLEIIQLPTKPINGIHIFMFQELAN